MQPIAGFEPLSDTFDALIIDQFGVLHDGVRPYPGARDCLERLHEAGKRMVLLSNSGRRSRQNEERLVALGFPMALLDAVITSGEVAWSALRSRADPFHRGLGRRCVLIAEPGDDDFLAGLGLERAESAEAADFLLAVSVGTSPRVVADREALLQAGVRRGLPMLCANNDVVRPPGAGLAPAPGALALRYAGLGGRVHSYGKPLASFFEHCLGVLEGVARERVVMVGDSLDHDILGAQNAQLRSVYIRGGIGSGAGTGDLAERVRAVGASPTYVMPHFEWRGG